MNFGQAIEALKINKKVARVGWNGKGMFLYLVGGAGKYLPYISMYTAQGTVVPWLASQTDILSEDWEVIE